MATARREHTWSFSEDREFSTRCTPLPRVTLRTNPSKVVDRLSPIWSSWSCGKVSSRNLRLAGEPTVAKTCKQGFVLYEGEHTTSRAHSTIHAALALLTSMKLMGLSCMPAGCVQVAQHCSLSKLATEHARSSCSRNTESLCNVQGKSA